MNYTPGTIINGRYRLSRQIGSGSFGEVWLANDTKVDDIEVAIKFYVALDPRGLDEFRNEFKNAHGLSSPYLLRIDYFDFDGNRPYLIMPFCPASSASLVGNATEEQLWRFLSHVSAGLGYLHSHDILHRDIKPDNVMVDRDGNFVITDFGLSMKMRSTLRSASRRENDIDKTGSISYMAPELFSSRPIAVNATDIWALGASAYELATGTLPFFGQGGIMETHGAEVPELPGHFSPRLNSLVMSCLAKETWDRPTADVIHSVAEKGLNGGLEPTVPPPPPAPTLKKTEPVESDESGKKRRHYLLFLALVLVIVGTALSVVFLSTDKAEPDGSDTPDVVATVAEIDTVVAVEETVEETVVAVDAEAEAKSEEPEPAPVQARPAPRPAERTPQPAPAREETAPSYPSLSQAEQMEILRTGIDNIDLPIKCGDGVTVYDIRISGSDLTFSFKIDETNIDIYQLNSNKQAVGREIYNNFRSSDDANMKFMLKTAKSAGIKRLMFIFKGAETGASTSIPITI